MFSLERDCYFAKAEAGTLPNLEGMFNLACVGFVWVYQPTGYPAAKNTKNIYFLYRVNLSHIVVGNRRQVPELPCFPRSDAANYAVIFFFSTLSI